MDNARKPTHCIRRDARHGTSPGTLRTAAADGAVPASAAAASCAEAARLLCRLLERIPWSHLRYADRRRLGRVLDRAAGKIALARTVLPGPDGGDLPVCGRERWAAGRGEGVAP